MVRIRFRPAQSLQTIGSSALGNAATASGRGPPAEQGWQGSVLAPSENPVTRR
jgi:hypothetical protein